MPDVALESARETVGKTRAVFSNQSTEYADFEISLAKQSINPAISGNKGLGLRILFLNALASSIKSDAESVSPMNSGKPFEEDFRGTLPSIIGLTVCSWSFWAQLTEFRHGAPRNRPSLLADDDDDDDDDVRIVAMMKNTTRMNTNLKMDILCVCMSIYMWSLSSLNFKNKNGEKLFFFFAFSLHHPDFVEMEASSKYLRYQH